MTELLSCLLVDDSPPILDALTRLLIDEGFEVVGTAETGELALEFLTNEPADIVILDVRLPDICGLEVARRAALIAPSRIVFYTSYADPPFVKQALEVGAHAVVLKDAPPSNLLDALHAVARGDDYVDARLNHCRNRGPR